MKRKVIGVISSVLIGLMIGFGIIVRSNISSAPADISPTPTFAPAPAQTWYIKSDAPVAGYDCPSIDCNVVATFMGGTAVSVIGPAQGEAMVPVSDGRQVIFILDNWLSKQSTPIERPGVAPSGATALCKDGWVSYSQHRQGTCSHHKGVRTWYR
ncbi:MAG: DUF3761 domain-containing protein [Aggregatilineales bacterium]